MPGFSGTKTKMKAYNKKGLNTLESHLQGGGLTNNPLYQQGSQYLSGLLSGDPSSYQDQFAPEIRQFNEETAPGIAERFAGLGTGAGASNSSALSQSLSQAGAMLSERLAAMRANQQLGASQQALQYAQQPIANEQSAAGQIPGQYYERQGQPGWGQSLLKAGLKTAVGAAKGFGTGGGIGAAHGAFSSLAGGLE
jgi:hypothetical protein